MSVLKLKTNKNLFKRIKGLSLLLNSKDLLNLKDFIKVESVLKALKALNIRRRRYKPKA